MWPGFGRNLALGVSSEASLFRSNFHPISLRLRRVKEHDMPGFEWEFVKGTTLPKFDNQLRLCYDTDSSTAWLEITGMESLVTGSAGTGVVKIYIGAVKGAGGWEAIPPAKVNTFPKPSALEPGASRSSLTWQFCDTSKIVAFQQAV